MVREMAFFAYGICAYRLGFTWFSTIKRTDLTKIRIIIKIYFKKKLL